MSDVLNDVMNTPLEELPETVDLPEGVYVLRLTKYEVKLNSNDNPFAKTTFIPVEVENVDGLTQEALEEGSWWPVRGQMYLTEGAKKRAQRELEQCLGSEGDNFRELFENALGNETRAVVQKNDRGYLEVAKLLRPKKDAE